MRKGQRTFAGTIQGPGDDLAPVSEGLCMNPQRLVCQSVGSREVVVRVWAVEE